jgi:hypothetical protein
MPFLVMVHPGFIYWEMSNILPSAARKEIQNLFGRGISSLSEYVHRRWKGTPTEGSIAIVGAIHDTGYEE